MASKQAKRWNAAYCELYDFVSCQKAAAVEAYSFTRVVDLQAQILMPLQAPSSLLAKSSHKTVPEAANAALARDHAVVGWKILGYGKSSPKSAMTSGDIQVLDCYKSSCFCCSISEQLSACVRAMSSISFNCRFDGCLLQDIFSWQHSNIDGWKPILLIRSQADLYCSSGETSGWHMFIGTFDRLIALFYRVPRAKVSKHMAYVACFLNLSQ